MKKRGNIKGWLYSAANSIPAIAGDAASQLYLYECIPDFGKPGGLLCLSLFMFQKGWPQQYCEVLFEVENSIFIARYYYLFAGYIPVREQLLFLHSA
ncbi:MAG: hypothetical protein R3F53_12665 [Gammaproteobacteria bacterium]